MTDDYERFIASGEYAFRRRDDAERLRDVIKFRWEMVSTEDGSVAGIGLEFLVIDAADPPRLPIHRELSRSDDGFGTKRSRR